MSLCFDSVVFVTQHRNAVSHDFYVSSFLLSSFTLLGYTTRGPRKSPLLSPFHFHALSVPPRARGARSSSCRRRNPSRVLPSASLTDRLVHVRTHNPAEMAMTSDKHFGIFLCLTALGKDTNLVPSYCFIHSLFIYYVWGITDFFSKLAAFCQRLHYALHFLSFLCFCHHIFLCEAGYSTILNKLDECLSVHRRWYEERKSN